MKKFYFVLIAVICISSVNAQEKTKTPFAFSAGGGAFVGGSFSHWSVDKDLPGDLHRYNSSHLSVGPFLFIDFNFVEINIGFPLGFLNADDTMADNPNFPARTYALRGGAYLKYPFSVSQRLVLFPLIGVDYDLYLLAKRDDDRDATFPISSGNQNAKPMDALNTLWLKAGAGMDASLTENIFLRTEFLYGIRLPNEMEKYLKNSRNGINFTIFHGGDIKMSVGYRF